MKLTIAASSIVGIFAYGVAIATDYAVNTSATVTAPPTIASATVQVIADCQPNSEAAIKATNEAVDALRDKVKAWVKDADFKVKGFRTGTNASQVAEDAEGKKLHPACLAPYQLSRTVSMKVAVAKDKKEPLAALSNVLVEVAKAAENKEVLKKHSKLPYTTFGSPQIAFDATPAEKAKHTKSARQIAEVEAWKEVRNAATECDRGYLLDSITIKSLTVNSTHFHEGAFAMPTAGSMKAVQESVPHIDLDDMSFTGDFNVIFNLPVALKCPAKVKEELEKK